MRVETGTSRQDDERVPRLRLAGLDAGADQEPRLDATAPRSQSAPPETAPPHAPAASEDTRSASVRCWPQMLIATTIVAVLPICASLVLRASGVISSPIVAMALAMMMSLIASSAGSAYWRKHGRVDLVFGELLLWGWLRRWRHERQLANAVRLLAAVDTSRITAKARIERRQLLLNQLAGALEGPDVYLNGHSRRVARHAAMIARELGLPSEQAARIRAAAAIHDVGKLKTPKAILNKPGRLTDAEFAVIKQHPVDGAKLVAGLADPELAAIVKHHHERMDGTGYPDGLVGEAIPLGARIVAVADTFDALTSARTYRGAAGHERAIEIIRNASGSQLDPAAVRAFLAYYSGKRPALLWTTATSTARNLISPLTSNSAAAATLTTGKAAAAITAAAAIGAVAAAAPVVVHAPRHADLVALAKSGETRAGTRGRANASSSQVHTGATGTTGTLLAQATAPSSMRAAASPTTGGRARQITVVGAVGGMLSSATATASASATVSAATAAPSASTLSPNPPATPAPAAVQPTTLSTTSTAGPSQSPATIAGTTGEAGSAGIDAGGTASTLQSAATSTTSATSTTEDTSSTASTGNSGKSGGNGLAPGGTVSRGKTGSTTSSSTTTASTGSTSGASGTRSTTTTRSTRSTTTRSTSSTRSTTTTRSTSTTRGTSTTPSTTTPSGRGGSASPGGRRGTGGASTSTSTTTSTKTASTSPSTRTATTGTTTTAKTTSTTTTAKTTSTSATTKTASPKTASTSTSTSTKTTATSQATAGNGSGASGASSTSQHGSHSGARGGSGVFLFW